jgi:hypothetical protein
MNETEELFDTHICYLTALNAGKELDLSRCAFNREIRKGNIKALFHKGRYYIDPADIEKYKRGEMAGLGVQPSHTITAQPGRTRGNIISNADSYITHTKLFVESREKEGPDDE